ncbi:pentatricopeptide repeat-containing protein At3g20730-like [Solanum stenotomum]|uniref:pentatricopeptide repeat-containing protein At3g20730-like n=1 Tax=Solanum stenotomum TaxID=172797 RepID=UPI0020D0EE07|nr:pentatricopeptide repeat-containing protein At3g20730-like [Solanum stenotomum]
MNRTYRNVVNRLSPTSQFPPLKSSIESLCNAKRLTEALRLAFNNPIEADYTIYSNIIQLCIDLKAHKQGHLVHSHLITIGFPSNVHLGTKLIIFYTMSGDMVSARKIFDKLPERNVVSWTALLSGYSQNGDSQEALNVFVAMRREGVRANQFTYGSVLRACTSVSCINLGKQIQGCIQKSRFVGNLYVQSALVNFNSKCGEMEDAFCVFESMAERDLISWNVMISGYAFRVYNIDAFLLFRWMFRQVLEGKMECSKKFVMVFTICLMVLLAFGNAGVLAAEAPAPSPTMESAGVTLFVPLLMAVIASMAAVFF